MTDKIKNIFGEEMDSRDCIGVVLDALYDDFNISPTDKMKSSKLATWHLALEELSDKAIAAGYKKCVSEQLKFIPSSGVFRAYCINPPKIKEYVELPDVPMSEEAKKKLEIAKANFFKRIKNNELMDKFVTSNVEGLDHCTQGWVVEVDPIKIELSDGKIYECIGEPVILTFQPERKTK